MFRIILLIIAITCTLKSVAQGIRFETGDWKSVLVKAQQAKKLIYLDVYTTWCGPCRILEHLIFPLEEAGTKFNSNFINYRIDAEKGEGLDIASRYNVTSYPTHLFINPVNQEIVFRETGATREVEEFNEHADMALEQYADRTSLAQYAQFVKEGTCDRNCFRKYLRKISIQQLNNDTVLTAYVSVISSVPVVDSEVLFLVSNIATIDNTAAPYILQHKDILLQLAGDDTESLTELMADWINGTFKKAVTNRNEKLLDLIITESPKYIGKQNDWKPYSLKTDYFYMTEDEPAVIKAGLAEANFIMNKPGSFYKGKDKEALEEELPGFYKTLDDKGMAKEEQKVLLDTILAANPYLTRKISINAAKRLNFIAWNIFAKHRKETPLLEQAIPYAKRAMELSVELKEWYDIADTYAHLLYALGKTENAIEIQADLVAKMRLMNLETEEKEAELEKMRNKTL